MWVDGLVRQYTQLHPDLHRLRMNQHIREATKLSRLIADAVLKLSKAQDQVDFGTSIHYIVFADSNPLAFPMRSQGMNQHIREVTRLSRPIADIIMNMSKAQDQVGSHPTLI